MGVSALRGQRSRLQKMKCLAASCAHMKRAWEMKGGRWRTSGGRLQEKLHYRSWMSFFFKFWSFNTSRLICTPCVCRVYFPPPVHLSSPSQHPSHNARSLRHALLYICTHTHSSVLQTNFSARSQRDALQAKLGALSTMEMQASKHAYIHPSCMRKFKMHNFICTGLLSEKFKAAGKKATKVCFCRFLVF